MQRLLHEQSLSEAEKLYQEGLAALCQSNFLYAQSVLENSLRLSRHSAQPGEIARTLRTLAIVMAYQQDYEAARRNFEQSLALREVQGDGQGVATLWLDLGVLEQQRGNILEAQRCFEESLPLQEAANNRKYVAYLHLFLGRLALRLESPRDALHHFQCSLHECESLRDRECGADVLRGLALLALHKQEKEWALRMTAAADAVAPLSEDHPHFLAIENLKTTLRTEFGDEAFGQLYSIGYAMTWEQAVSEAASIP